MNSGELPRGLGFDLARSRTERFELVPVVCETSLPSYSIGPEP